MEIRVWVETDVRTKRSVYRVEGRKAKHCTTSLREVGRYIDTLVGGKEIESAQVICEPTFDIEVRYGSRVSAFRGLTEVEKEELKAGLTATQPF